MVAFPYLNQFKLDFFITVSLMKIIYFSGPPDSKSLRNTLKLVLSNSIVYHCQICSARSIWSFQFNKRKFVVWYRFENRHLFSIEENNLWVLLLPYSSVLNISFHLIFLYIFFIISLNISCCKVYLYNYSHYAQSVFVYIFV
jgi:hypothetical protein